MKRNIFALFVGQVISWWTQIRLRSLRVRLALWGLLLLGVTQIVVSLVLYIAISTWLEEQVDSNLILTATQMSSVLYDPEEPQNPLDVTDVQEQLANTSNIAAESFLHDQLFFVRLVSLQTGAVLGTSADYSIPVLQSGTTEERFDTVSFRQDSETHEVRLYTMPLSYKPALALQVGTSLEETREIQGEVSEILVFLLIFICMVAPLSGWFLANRALVPIRAIACTAAEINETDLSRRLDLATSEVELVQLRQTFNAMLDRIEQAFLRQRKFTADAAHELRTPLSVMRTGLEVTLGQTRSVPEYQACLVSVQEEVQRLSQLTNTLLMLARADANELSLEIREFDLSLMLNTMVDQFEFSAAQKRISITSAIKPDLLFQGDEIRLIQVVYNLLDNALKYTVEGGEIKVNAYRRQNRIQIEIQDTGIGIALADQSKIFTRFYRVDQARTRNQGGFGLGLAISKQIIDLHNGQIQVKSDPTHGTTFVVTLPLPK